MDKLKSGKLKFYMNEFRDSMKIEVKKRIKKKNDKILRAVEDDKMIENLDCKVFLVFLNF